MLYGKLPYHFLIVLILQQHSFLKQYYLCSIYPRMEKFQKSLGCDYKISQNRSKAKNKIGRSKPTLCSQTSQNLGAHPRDPPGSSPISPPSQ